MNLFHKDPKRTADKIYQRFLSSLFQSNGDKHVLDAPLSAYDPRKLNIKMNYLIDEMRSKGYTIIKTDPKFICDSTNNVVCHFIVIYK